jgi:hypothetical protein
MIILKNLLRFLKYYFGNFGKKKPVYNNDKNYDFVKKLRQDGFIISDIYSKKITSGKKLIEYFKLIDDKKLDEFIINNQNASGKNSYKIYITSFFESNLLYQFANDETILSEVRQYFGINPVIKYISVWADQPNNQVKDNIFTQKFHRDPDDNKLIKIFMYLNKVDMNNGPFTYIKSSHKNPWRNFSGKEYNIDKIYNFYGKNSLCHLIGDPGTIILADTNGLHCGKKLKNGRRYLITVAYCSDKPRIPIKYPILQ